MLEFLKELISKFWDSIVPFGVIEQWQRALVLRWGVYHREIGPGFHWKYPFYEEWICDSVVTDTQTLTGQPLTTKDDKPICIQAMLTFHVKDLRKLLLEVEEKEKALYDVSSGVIGFLVSQHTWEEIHTAEFLDKVYRAIRQKGFKYGIEVTEVQFPALQKMRSYMIMQQHRYT